MMAPDFELPDQNGRMRKLSEYLGKWLIVYFYPKDDTPGCSKEACSFRDSKDDFRNLNVEIVGISKDSVNSHIRFATKYNLNFSLLSDESGEIIEKYGAGINKKVSGKETEGISRNTYLINPQGEIVKKYIGVDPVTHSDELLKDLRQIARK